MSLIFKWQQKQIKNLNGKASHPPNGTAIKKKNLLWLPLVKDRKNSFEDKQGGGGGCKFTSTIKFTFN